MMSKCDLAYLYKISQVKKRYVLLLANVLLYLQLPSRMARGSPSLSRTPWVGVMVLVDHSLMNSPATTTTKIHDEFETNSNQQIGTGVEGETSNNSFQERREITAFTEDNQILTDSVSKITNLNQNLISAGNEHRTHSVIDFLKRPEKVATVTWATSDATLTNLVSLPIPSSILTDMYRQKLQGFGLLRADIVFKLQFNSQPFQAGRLIATYTPVPGYLGYRNAYCYRSLQRLTALPSVIIDLSKQTEVNIQLPYVSSFTHFDLTTGGGDWGQFDLWVYSRLSSASTQSVNISIRTFLDNVQLGALTQQALVSPMSLVLSKGTIGAKRSLRKVSLQMADLESIQMKEERAGLVSTIGHSVRRVGFAGLNAIGKFIPAIDTIATAANGVSMSVLNAFAAFGLGKPSNLQKPQPIVVDSFSNFACGDGVDNSHVIAMRGGNTIEPLPGFAGSNTDELSLTYLMQTLQFIGNFSITTSQAVGTKLWTTEVSPFKLDPSGISTTVKPSTAALVTTSPCLQWYIASNFRQWRGDLIFHIALVKTDYHSVRLKFVFDPLAQDSTSINYANSEYCYSVVLDFREKTDFYVRVPFVSPTPWKSVLGSTYAMNDIVTPYPGVDANEAHCGMVGLFIDNTLQASSAVVAQSVDCLVEFCCAQNFDLSAPTGGMNFLPVAYDPSKYVTPMEASFPASFKVELQSGFTAEGVAKTRSATQCNTEDIESLTGAPMSDKDDKVTNYTVGEQIFSLRALIKRFNFVYKSDVNEIFNFTPRVQPLQPIDYVTDQLVSFYNGTPSLYDVVGSIFAFHTGGIRYKVHGILQDIVMAETYTGYPTFRYISGEDNDYTAQIGSNVALALDCSRVKGSFEFQVPYYSRAYNRVNTFATTAVDVNDLVAWELTQSETRIRVSPNNATTLCLSKAAAEDSTFGFILGVPDCISAYAYKHSTSYFNPIPSE